MHEQSESAEGEIDDLLDSTEARGVLMDVRRISHPLRQGRRRPGEQGVRRNGVRAATTVPIDSAACATTANCSGALVPLAAAMVYAAAAGFHVDARGGSASED